MPGSYLTAARLRGNRSSTWSRAGADAPHTAGFGDGAGIVIWLPGRLFTGGRAAAIEGAGAASQVPADCNPEVYDEGFWSRVDAWAGQFGLTGPVGIVQASKVPAAG